MTDRQAAARRGQVVLHLEQVVLDEAVHLLQLRHADSSPFKVVENTIAAIFETVQRRPTVGCQSGQSDACSQNKSTRDSDLLSKRPSHVYLHCKTDALGGPYTDSRSSPAGNTQQFCLHSDAHPDHYPLTGGHTIMMLLARTEYLMYLSAARPGRPAPRCRNSPYGCRKSSPMASCGRWVRFYMRLLSVCR